MADSTTNLDLLTPGQGSKEVTANAVLDALSPASLFGRRASTTAALTWGYYGGKMIVGGVVTSIANGTVALSASQTNYVEADSAGTVTKNTTAFTSGRIPLYTVITGASSVTSYTDQRTPGLGGGAQSTGAITTTPSTPTSGATYYVDNSAGIDMPSWVTSDGTVLALEIPHWGLWRVRQAIMGAASSNLLGVGCTATSFGTAQAGGSINSSAAYFYNFVRPVLATGSSAGAFAGVRIPQSDIWRGNASNQGGFFCTFQFSHTLKTTNGRCAVGLFNSTGVLANADPSAQVDCVFVGWDAADTHLQVMCNDATGACSKVDLGASFPSNTQLVDVYFVAFYAKPNASNIFYYVKRLNTGDVASGSLTSNLPTSTTVLSAQQWASNGADASDVRFNPLKTYIATQY